jgi:hypothetical protein
MHSVQGNDHTFLLFLSFALKMGALGYRLPEFTLIDVLVDAFIEPRNG